MKLVKILLLEVCLIAFCSSGFAADHEIPDDSAALSSTINSLQLNKNDCNYQFLRDLMSQINKLAGDKKRPSAERVVIINYGIVVGNQIRNCRRNKLLN